MVLTFLFRQRWLGLVGILLAWGAQGARRPKSSPPHEDSYQIQLSLASWSDTGTLVAPTSARSTIGTSTLALAFGLRREISVAPQLRLGAEIEGLWGKSDAALSPRASPASGTYTSLNVGMVGFRMSPSLAWVFNDEKLSVGLRLPLLLQKSSFAAPPSSFELVRPSAFALGWQVEARMRRANFILSSRLGLLRFTKGFQWEIGAGIVL